ncbi:predicted protein [Nematostella vectensis]|uniref:Amine oxidase n=1 Tax=Nematostella vectensis TaxID=45351 RepID=A7S6X6_NEMVE|nr:amine oxidase [flavin-containing] [Nematostella vectensis]EDO40503.1 predicted protein [Nematostella vectensis]|eukprot:XP_001632566.1 predicted protein [Nematostella vectensis]
MDENHANHTEELRADIIVIGGGISGLCAAKLLQQGHGVDTLVLEARDRVGGRTETLVDPRFKYTDLGGAYVGPTQNRILRVAKELGVETYQVFFEGKVSEYLGGSRRFYSGEMSTWNPIAILDYYSMVKRIGNMCKQISVDAPWNTPQALEWDRMTVEEFFEKMCLTNYCKKRMVQIYHDAMAAEPWNMSLLYYLWYLKSGDGMLRVAGVENAGQERKFVGGSQQISNKLKERLGDRVILNSSVVKIAQDEDHVVVTCENGKSYKAQYVISAMPQALLNQVSFNPPLPALKNQLIQRIPMGSVIKTITFYDKPFWREKGLNGCVIADSESGPVQAGLDDTKPDGSHPALMGFIIGDQALSMCQMTQEERKKAVCAQYAKIFNCEEALHPCCYIEKNWLAEKYSGGCYVSVVPCGILTKFRDTLTLPVGRVHFAGTETATIWCGYMDGAVQAGERAAREILHKMGKIPSNMINQEEPPSQEVVAMPCTLTAFERCLPSVPTAVTAILLGGILIARYLRAI